MRILIIGGVDGQLRISTYRFLVSQGHQVAVVAPCKLPEVVAIGCEVFTYNLVRNISFIDDGLAIKDLRRIFKIWSPDLVHSFDSKPNYLVPIASFGFSDIKVVRTINGLGRFFSSKNINNPIFLIVFWMLHYICRPAVNLTIFQNEADMKYFLSHLLVSRQKVSLIPGSGVNAKQLREVSCNTNRLEFRTKMDWQDSVVFILVSRVIEEKGIYEFMEASRLLKKISPLTKCVIVGPAAEGEINGIELKDIDAYADSITYLGERNDVPRLLSAADVFVLPTKYREGIPRSLLEAMAIGKPTIVSDMPGCGETVAKAECGLVVRAGDIEGLFSAMKNILSSDFDSLGRCAQQAVEKWYSHTVVMDKLEKEYLSIR